MKHSSERSFVVPENMRRKQLYESAAAVRNTQRRLVSSQYGSRPLDIVRDDKRALFNDYDIQRFAQQYHDEQRLIVPEGLDLFLATRAPKTREELALWLHVCLEKQGLIGPFTIHANPLQPDNCSHLDFMADAFFENVGDCIVLGNRFGMKCHGINTPIMMYDKKIKMVQDVRVGDLLMGDDLQPRTVLSAGSGIGKLYQVSQSSGIPYVINDAHIITVRNKWDEIPVDINIEEYLHIPYTKRIKLCGYKQGLTVEDDSELHILSKGIGDYYGFVIDGNGRYLLGDRTVTHNTLNFAALMFAECLHKPGIEIAHLAAIETQAQNCYNYFLKFTQHPLFNTVLARKATQSQSDFKNGSRVQILIGTVTGVNSPHPNVTQVDEVELMEPRILQEAMNMATSNKKSASQTKEYRSATRLTSSRKKSTGTMQKMIDEADTRGFKIYQWNVWDTIERCHIPNWSGAKFPVKDEIWGNKLTLVPEECAGCTMMQLDPPRCLGKASKSNGGIVRLQDIMQKVKNLDLEVWIAQHECARPGTSDLLFAMFDKQKHVINYELLLRELDLNIAYAELSANDYYARVPYCPDLPVYAAQDEGFVCPATIFAQLVDDWLIIFHEIKQERIAPSLYIKNFLLPAYEAFNPDLWICDPAGMVLVSDMEVAGIQGIILAENKVDIGIENVRARLGADLLYFDYKCANCIQNLENYSDDDFRNQRKRRTFHFADCIRYLSTEFVYYAQTMDKVYYA